MLQILVVKIVINVGSDKYISCKSDLFYLVLNVLI